MAKITGYDDVWAELCTDRTYPCQYCRRKDECIYGCPKWALWARNAWRQIRGGMMINKEVEAWKSATK